MHTEEKAPIHVTHVAPSALRPAAYNPRQMSEAARRRLERSMREFGCVDPIIARREDGLVIGGHQRLAAAVALGLETVPVVYLEGVDDDRAAALNVALNNPAAQGGWDMAKLSDLLSELDAHGFDATLTGFDESELEQLLTWTPEAARVEDAPAEPSAEPQYLCLVTCRDERELAAVYEELSQRGYACKLIT